MKNKTPYLSIGGIALAILFSSTSITFAQNNRIVDFIRAGREDAETLTRAYLEPLPNGFGGNLNTGWFNSASTHGTLGFDIQIRGALAFIPSSDQSFNLNDLDLNRVELAEGEPRVSPTAGGDDKTGPEVIVQDDDGDEVDRFNLPQGSGFHFTPAPMIQASVGLIKNTDISVRFVPEVKIDEYGDFTMRGVGLKHSLSQWLPGSNLLPVDISVFAGYNRVTIDANLNLDPQEGAVPTDPTVNYDNQQVETSFDSFSAKLLVGKDLPFISVYGAVGYETSTLNLDVTGNYPVTVSTAGVERTETITDPFSYSDTGDNRFSLTGGLKFNILFFNIFGDYTLAKYPVANAGIGFSFR